MRVRLTVQRNNLPASNILWTIPSTTSLQAYTVSRLLEDVNHVIPLEAEQWGLEDYIVEVGGFECLHFAPVFGTLKEDDHVCIRPLLTAEVRSRTLCGRTQISEDGRHLIDGISFGRPRLRQPHRPAVNIPPRKRRRLEEDTIGGNESFDSTGLITAAGEATSSASESRSKKDKKQVQFAHTDEDWEDSEGDEDFMPGHVSEGSIDSDSDDDSSIASEASAQPEADPPQLGFSERSASDSSSASETDSSSDTSSDSDVESASEGRVSVEASSDTTSDSTDSESESDSDSDSDSSPDVISSKTPVPPFSGSKQTRKRNYRRRALSKLNHLKAEGKLHPEAGLADLRVYLGESSAIESDSTAINPGRPMSKSSGKRKRLEADAEEPKADLSGNESTELERRKKELIARLTEDTVDTQMLETDSISATVRAASETPRQSDSSATRSDPATKQDTDTPTPSTKRLRPNVSAIGRILKRQAVNIERKPKKTPVVEEPPEPEGASDPDFWKSRVNISAFECWDEDHELSAPPYPFEQHWDPASKLMRENQQNAKKKKKKNTQTQELAGWPIDNVDEEPEDTPVLDYDDSPETMKAASDPTDAIESQIMQDVQLATQADLPPLPDDISALPALYPNNIQVGAVLVFKLWTIDPVTVTPNISEYKTAIVEKEGDSGNGAGTFRLRFADRDLPKKMEGKVDEKGRPIKNAVSGFRMDDDESEDDESIWEGMFAELVEPKLLQAADQARG